MIALFVHFVWLLPVLLLFLVIYGIREARIKKAADTPIIKEYINTLVKNQGQNPIAPDTIQFIKNQLWQSNQRFSAGEINAALQRKLTSQIMIEYARISIGESVWPAHLTVTEQGLDGLYTLFEQRGIKLNKHQLLKMANDELKKQGQTRFEESFRKFKPSVANANETKEIVSLYVDLFGEAYKQQLSRLEAFLRSKKRMVTQKTLEEMIRAEIKRRADSQMAASIASAIQSGHALRSRTTIDDIDSMDGIEFEQFLQKLFIAMGYKVQVTKASGDQGADLLMEKFGRKVAVQAKRYNHPVGNKAVQEVMAAMNFYRYSNGMVITNSSFTPSAEELARSSSIELIDRRKLMELLKQYEV